MSNIKIVSFDAEGTLIVPRFSQIIWHEAIPALYSQRWNILKGRDGITGRMKSVIVQHHECHNGTGYPNNLKGNQIDLFARITSVADVFVTITRNRPYRGRNTFYLAMKEVLSIGRTKFDPNVLRHFLACMSIYPVSSAVRLNTGEIGIVIAPNPLAPVRPYIKIILTQTLQRRPLPSIINLRQYNSIFIKESIIDEKFGLDVYNEF